METMMDSYIPCLNKYSENHNVLLFHSSEGLKKDLEKLYMLADKYPDNCDIIASLSDFCKLYIQSIQQSDMASRITKMNRRMLALFEKIDLKNPEKQEVIHKIVRNISHCLREEYLEYHDFAAVKDKEHKNQNFCEDQISKFYMLFPDEKMVVKSFETINSEKLMDDYGSPVITKEQCDQYKVWFETYPDELKFAEDYGKVLFMRYCYLMAQGETEETEKCQKEIERVARIACYEDNEQANQLKDILRMIQDGIV